MIFVPFPFPLSSILCRSVPVYTRVFVCQSHETDDERCQDTYVSPPRSAPSLPPFTVSFHLHCHHLYLTHYDHYFILNLLLPFLSFISPFSCPSSFLLLTFLLCFIWITSFFHSSLLSVFSGLCVNVRYDGGQGFTH